MELFLQGYSDLYERLLEDMQGQGETGSLDTLRSMALVYDKLVASLRVIANYRPTSTIQSQTYCKQEARGVLESIGVDWTIAKKVETDERL
jgi:regulator of sigma D